MWMTDYIAVVKRNLRDLYNCPLVMENGKPKGTENDPCVIAEDGDYTMEIDGQIDYVKIVNGRISCCNFKKGE